MTTERRIARNMTFLLDRGVDRLDAPTVLRLQSARQRALDSLSAGGMPIHGAPGAWRYLLRPLARGACSDVAGRRGGGADRWKGEQHLREAIAVDAARCLATIFRSMPISTRDSELGLPKTHTS